MVALRHALAILILPFTATVVLPALLLGPDRWRLAASWALASTALGVAFVGLGLALVAGTIALFARVGKGTLAPWDPPRRLVVRGVYRHVRNPMISGVLAILLGEALALRSSALLAWFATFLAANLLYIPGVEEPMMVRRFPGDYEEYRRHVPRWIPRLTPWQSPSR
ncbi:MAG TPA: isoprenylcysteine carboxylmethyltransferase family protein [Candidatus Binatia bacterium]|nr:isoprenylcysteine carboxylmethyltransferase family protein [Candidatus Binatia bacterium]